MNYDNMTWQCDICREERPDAKISVRKIDITPFNLPPGTVTRNVKHCNDDPECLRRAMGWQEKVRTK